MELDTVEKILDFAIGKEEEAAAFYTDMAAKMDHKHMKDVFLSFAAEEKMHKRKLEAVKAGQQLVLEKKKIMDLKMAEFLKDVTHLT